MVHEAFEKPSLFLFPSFRAIAARRTDEERPTMTMSTARDHVGVVVCLRRICDRRHHQRGTVVVVIVKRKTDSCRCRPGDARKKADSNYFSTAAAHYLIA